MSRLAEQNTENRRESHDWRQGSRVAVLGNMDVLPATEQQLPAIPRHGGFSLIEAVIATGLLATLVVGLGQVFLISSRAIHIARVRTLAAILAGQKMEQLRSLSWAHSPGGGLLSDVTTNLAVEPPSAGGPGLSGAPLGALDQDVPLYVDYADASGARTPTATSAAFVRRWSVSPLASDPQNLLMLEVRVVTVGGGDARLASIKARRP
jgi:type II secretory pathway pseudopilin PulG